MPVKARKRVWEREVRLDKLGLNKWQYLQVAGAQEGGPGWGERSESKGPGRAEEGRATPDVEGPKEKPEQETGLNRPKRLEYRVGAAACPAAGVKVNLDPSHRCSLEPWERGQGRGSPGPQSLSTPPQGPPRMGNSQERPSETIDRERKRLVETLQADSGLLLDALLARGVLTGPEYEALDALPDAERRVRRLLLMVQSKGEAACQELLRCAQRTVRAPDPAWDWQHVGPGERAGRSLRQSGAGRGRSSSLPQRWAGAEETAEG